ncbi:MAG TPA: lysylphosphatidylglycerol synthase domain-containing protein [Kofleriaceae bacterium]|nr:lysylphosphatidylglycerol synthase domain-containing protein [Kofleriaceae bacterium]
MKKSALRERLIRWIIGISSIVAFGFVLRTVDLAETFHLLTSRGPILALALVPYFVQIALDSRAWRILLGALGRRVSWFRLICIRLSTEAVLMSVPAGGIVGETLKPYLLAKTDRVPAAETVASIGVKKCLLVFAEATYLSLALMAGHALLVAHSEAIVHGSELPWMVLAAILFLILVGAGLALLVTMGSVSGRTHRLLVRLPWPRVRRWLEDRHAKFAYADSCFVKIGRAHGPLFRAYGCLLAAWFVESFETWLLLHLLGFDVSFTAAFTMEAAVVFLRNLAFFVPAGLGVQDAGYLAFLGAFGIGSVGGGAFVILKRAKEAIWVGVGYVVLLVLEGKRTAEDRSALEGITA